MSLSNLCCRIPAYYRLMERFGYSFASDIDTRASGLLRRTETHKRKLHHIFLLTYKLFSKEDSNHDH